VHKGQSKMVREQGRAKASEPDLSNVTYFVKSAAGVACAGSLENALELVEKTCSCWCVSASVLYPALRVFTGVTAMENSSFLLSQEAATDRTRVLWICAHDRVQPCRPYRSTRSYP